MSADPKQIIVTERRCPSCSVHTVLVHHQTFPELQIEGLSAEKAAGHLVNRLGAALDSTLDPLHREAIQHALASLGFTGIHCPSLGDAMGLCLSIAHATKTIEFGTSIQPIYLQHAAQLAGA